MASTAGGLGLGMSANEEPPDSSYPAHILSSFTSRRTPAPGMDSPLSRNSPNSESREPRSEPTNMSTLALRTSSSVLLSPRHSLWDDARPQENHTRSHSPAEKTDKVELPSIRQAVPEIINSRAARDSDYRRRTQANSYSPTTRPGSLITPPEYAPSPSLHKRRRLSFGEDFDAQSKERVVPRIYRSPPQIPRPSSATLSPTSSARCASVYSSTESWSGSARNSPYMPAQRPTVVRSPPPFETLNGSRPDWRPTLPSLPSLTLERGPVQHPAQHPHGRSNWSEYALDTSRVGAHTYPQASSSYELPPSIYQPGSFSYGYQQPRGQSYPGPSSLAHDRTPFSGGQYLPGYPVGDYPYGMNDGNDGKQRKRRGNLPKETTDKLRAWFVLHLQHPYPTEDEKQDLMRQTGLQMNQISNWFINARRRQLPAMINNARAESDARTARVGERGEVSTAKRGSLPIGDSDGEGSGYDEEYEQTRAPRPSVQGPPKRESI